ncbi:MAG: preprotein translocase subunit SecE [Acidimicrobiia bacterium]|nr:preprotein translocase subunit SecE [Acidimicrobiia bacterium]
MNREQRRLQQREERRQEAGGQTARPTATARAQQAAARVEKRERTSFKQYLREVRQEMGKVAWPDRRTLLTYTVVSLITTVFFTALTSGLDFVFKTGVVEILNR